MYVCMCVYVHVCMCACTGPAASTCISSTAAAARRLLRPPRGQAKEPARALSAARREQSPILNITTHDPFRGSSAGGSCVVIFSCSSVLKTDTCRHTGDTWQQAPATVIRCKHADTRETHGNKHQQHATATSTSNSHRCKHTDTRETHGNKHQQHATDASILITCIRSYFGP
jgi:hypothetical protein